MGGDAGAVPLILPTLSFTLLAILILPEIENSKEDREIFDTINTRIPEL